MKIEHEYQMSLGNKPDYLFINQNPDTEIVMMEIQPVQNAEVSANITKIYVN